MIYLFKIFFFFLLILQLWHFKIVSAFCQTGCKCWDNLKKVECKNITTISILFHPMLKILSVRNSPNLKLEPVSIGLYQELEHLDLSYNNIFQIPEGFLTPFKKLRELCLRGNKLKLLDIKMFGKILYYNYNLNLLDVSDNELELIDSKIFTIGKIESSLKILNLSGNHLHFIDTKSKFYEIKKNLKILDLSRNRFSTIDINFFSTKPSLEYLDFSSNFFSEIPNNLFLMQSKLLKLNLSHNLISTIGPSAFNGLHSLRTLDLSNNLISKLDQFDLKTNGKYLSQLKLFYLSFNPIDELLALSFDGLYLLKELKLHQMFELKKIQAGTFAGLTNLENLQISNCLKLNYISSPLFSVLKPLNNNNTFKSKTQIKIDSTVLPTKLYNLDLSNNRLTTLSHYLLDNWNQLKHLNLAGNPWKCNCSLLKFLPSILRNINQTNTAICLEPEHLLNVKISTVQESTVCQSLNFNIGSIVILLTLLASILLIFTLIITFALLLYYCCWQKYLQQQKNRKQSLEKKNFSNILCDNSLFDQKSYKNYGRFNLPSIQQFPDLTLTKATICTNASNNILSRDTYSCVPLYSSNTGKEISFTESLTNKKANSNLNNFISDSNALSYCYSVLPTTNFFSKLSGRKFKSADYCCSNWPNIYNKKIINDENEYYSCIQADFQSPKEALKLKNKKIFNYCALKDKTKEESHYQSYYNGKKQILISFDNNTIEIPTNLFYLKKNYCLNDENYSNNDNNKLNKAITYDEQKLYLKHNSEFDTTVDSGCYVFPTISNFLKNDKLIDHNSPTQQYHLPLFIAPPSPSTIPPPPVDYITKMHLDNVFY